MLGRPGWTALACSEEHLPCVIRNNNNNSAAAAAASDPKRGDVVFVVPEHVCPTVNLAEQCVMVDGGVFVGLVDIEGRGHDVMCE